MIIDVITLWQPWATWVELELKPIETRTHTRFAGLVGKRIAIHAAARKDDPLAWPSAQQYMNTAQKQVALLSEYPRGVILCTVYVEAFRALNFTDCYGALIECETRRFGLILRDVERLTPAIPATGSRGVWKTNL